MRQEADERLARIIRWSATGEGSLRTHLDEWAAFEVAGELLTSGGRQRWFNNPCPWREWWRLARYMDWIIPEAAAVLLRGMKRDSAVRKPRRGDPAPFLLIVEHAVPVKVIGIAVRSDPRLQQTDALRDFLKHHFKRGVLTSGENERLNKARLRDSMPAGWRSWDDPFARYRTVRLERARITGLEQRQTTGGALAIAPPRAHSAATEKPEERRRPSAGCEAPPDQAV